MEQTPDTQPGHYCVKTATVNAYAYHELDERAKMRVREMLNGVGYAWFNESMSSIKAFCAHFGVKVLDYSIGGYQHSWVKTDADNNLFTLEKTKALPEFPTGYYLDDTLRSAFVEGFAASGDALSAFLDAIDEAVKAVVADIEYQDSDEAVAETCEFNKYLFDRFGHLLEVTA